LGAIPLDDFLHVAPPSWLRYRYFPTTAYITWGSSGTMAICSTRPVPSPVPVGNHVPPPSVVSNSSPYVPANRVRGEDGTSAIAVMDSDPRPSLADRQVDPSSRLRYTPRTVAA